MRTHNHCNRAVPRLLFAAALSLLCSPGLFATDGHFLHGAGPVNEAMGGADTGICLDATGSIAWNPACTTRFYGRRFEIHGTLFTPWRSLSSTVEANAFGPGMPAATLSGTTDSHRDMSVMPGFAFIYRRPGSSTAYHAAMLAVSGFGVDYNASTNFSNPILSPQAPNGFGFGRIRSNYMLVTVPVGFSRELSERLSAGFSVVPALSLLQVIPAPFSAPVTAGSTMPYYLSAGNQAPAFGLGFNAGVNYLLHAVSFGVAYHSPVWFQRFNWNREDLGGASQALNFKMDLPQLVSLGAGVGVTKSTRIGVDGRWFDYANAAGFSKVGYNPDGSVAGFGWRNIWAIGGGVQQRVGKSAALMGGYNYSGNPVPTQYTFFNTPAPAIVQHHVSGGIVKTIDKTDVIVTYYHAFQNSITGPWISAQGAIPGTSVTSKMSENSVTMGFAKNF